MIRAEVRTDTDILDAIAETAQKSPVLMRTAFTRNVQRLASRYVKTLKAAPPKFRGKRRWASDRQRKAYFASDGFGAGIPYVRTNALVKGWKVVYEGKDPFNGVVTFENDSPVARYVQGDDAQPMHLDSRWPQLSTAVSDARPELEAVAIETWFTVSTPTAGVRR